MLMLNNNGNLKKIQVIPNTLEYIALKVSPELDALPFFEQFSSLRVFELEGCYRVKKIHGLEHCTALERLRAHTRWEEAGIESLEQMKRLRKVQLKAFNRSGVEGCIQSMKKWPKEEIVVCARAIPDAATCVKSFNFSNLIVVDSFTKRKMNSVPSLKWPSAARCILLCFVVNRGFSQTSELCLEIESELSRLPYFDVYIEPMELEVGKWVWMAVLQRSSIDSSDTELWVHIGPKVPCPDGPVPDEVEKGLLVTGQEQRVVEAFTRLWPLLSY